jgi:hypothetical protein
MSQPAQAMAAQDAIHGRARMAKQRPKPIRSDAHPTPGEEDPRDRPIGQGSGSPTRPAGAVFEPGEAVRSVPPEPLVRRGSADPDSFRRHRGRPPVGDDPLDEEPSAERRQLGRTMEHESPPSVRSFDNPKPSTRALSLSTT